MAFAASLQHKQPKTKPEAKTDEDSALRKSCRLTSQNGNFLDIFVTSLKSPQEPAFYFGKITHLPRVSFY
jgi:hypothetical protein